MTNSTVAINPADINNDPCFYYRPEDQIIEQSLSFNPFNYNFGDIWQWTPQNVNYFWLVLPVFGLIPDYLLFLNDWDT